MEASEILGWPTRDPRWLGKVVVMSLITIIPIVGQMALYGWMLGALDNLRAGRDELPEAGFAYLGRGARLWVVLLVYALAVVLVAGSGSVAGAILASSAGRTGSMGAASLGTLLLLIGWAAAVLGVIGFYLFLPQIILATDRGGIAGGLQVRAIVAEARARPQMWIVAGLMSIVAHVIGGLGSLLCIVGVFLTIAYGYAMLAAVVHSYETQT